MKLEFAQTEVVLGVPAELLRRRPDIRQAEASAAAQSARIGIAKAELYPSFTLAGSIGYSAGTGSVPISPTQGPPSAAIFTPIFQR